MIQQKPYFDREVTGILKGIALIMMFVHHFFTFPSWWLDGISYPIIEKVAPYFCSPLKLCVPIFCFITGYCYYFNNTKTYVYSIKKITDILVFYWGVFLVFAIIAVIFVNYKYTLIDFIKEMFALYRPTMTFCWYVYFYCLIMLIFPLIVKIMSKNIHLDFLISLLIFPIVIRVLIYFVNKYVGNDILSEILGSLVWFPTVLVGYIFAKYNLFERIEKVYYKIIYSKKINIILCLVISVVVPMGRFIAPNMCISFGEFPIVHRTFTFWINMDIVYTPLFIYAVANLCKMVKVKYLKIVLGHIGKYSLLMWFVSCIFYNNLMNIFQPILYLPHNPVLVTIWGLFICYFVSVTLDFGLSKIKKVKNQWIFKDY